jgi:hypothetical protein
MVLNESEAARWIVVGNNALQFDRNGPSRLFLVQTHGDGTTREIWKPNRRSRTTPLGVTLRVQAPAPFRLRWSMDEWTTTQETLATPTALHIHYVDLPE